LKFIFNESKAVESNALAYRCQNLRIEDFINSYNELIRSFDDNGYVYSSASGYRLIRNVYYSQNEKRYNGK